jgi:hypothetical protein
MASDERRSFKLCRHGHLLQKAQAALNRYCGSQAGFLVATPEGGAIAFDFTGAAPGRRPTISSLEPD